MLRFLYAFFSCVAVSLEAEPAHAEPTQKEWSPARLPQAGPYAAKHVGPLLVGESRYYADSFLPLRNDVRAFEHAPENRYTHCIRNVATYECLSYGTDGNIRRHQHRATAHGTGFAYKHDGNDTLLLTNEHVVAWPVVTDAEHRAEEIPPGCKLVNQKLSIVDNEDDEYDEDDVPLIRVIDDRALDAAVVRAKGKLRLLPYRIGRPSALSTGDVVVVRGFPLGVFQAYNTGKVINTADEDRYKHWEHLDFIIDAQLSSGNSGSPVLALSRKTGEYELVGMFHASYSRAIALNAVIGIDQLRDLMFQLKRSGGTRPLLPSEELSAAEQRQRLRKALASKDSVPFIAFGPLIVRLHLVGEGFLFEIFTKNFPLDDRRVAFLLDAPVSDGIGKLCQAWFGNSRGYNFYNHSDLDAETANKMSDKTP